MERFNDGAVRMGFPTVDGEVFIELIKKLVSIDEHWIPTDPGCSLYIRPTMIGTKAGLGVTASTSALLYVMFAEIPVPRSSPVSDVPNSTASRLLDPTTLVAGNPSPSSPPPSTRAPSPAALATESSGSTTLEVSYRKRRQRSLATIRCCGCWASATCSPRFVLPFYASLPYQLAI